MEWKFSEVRNKRQVDLDIASMWIKMKEYGEEKLTFVIILKGGVFVAHKILSFMYGYDIFMGYLGLSSYKEGTDPQSAVEVTYPLDLPRECVEDRNVWIIDDVCQGGSTLKKAIEIVELFDPRTIRVAVLVDKPSFREKGSFIPDVVGFVYEGDKFLVGVGMGYGERYRSLHAVYELV